MKRTVTLLLAGLLLATNACQKSESSPTPAAAPADDPAALDRFIEMKMLSQGEFLWAWASDEQIWTALAYSDHVLSVGYRPADETNVEERLNQIDIQSPAWRQARAEALALALENERALNPALTENDMLAFRENGVLPVFDLLVHNPATIAALRGSPLVRYAEPIGYEPYMTRPAERSGSGCDSNDPDPNVNTSDYTTLAPGCKASWNYPYHNIAKAWDYSTGAGATLVIIDTGCSDDQENLGDDFNQGYSAGRSVSKFVTLPAAPGNPPETPHDGCGHGTSMEGAAAAPRGTDGAACGIAYNCNLITIRAAEDVYLDDSREVVGVSDAFTQASNTGEARIISMSMGRITTSNQIKDAVKYAYQQGKLIFCAAGTSFWWTAWFAGVIFPASMTEAVAVTGVKDNLTTKCSNCHVGSKVDFVVVMQKNSTGRNPLSLPMSGDAPSTVGGSSVATASTAGMAALVWAIHPGWTRQQVFDKLKTSSNYYPNRHSNFGWGRINAQVATQ